MRIFKGKKSVLKLVSVSFFILFLSVNPFSQQQLVIDTLSENANNNINNRNDIEQRENLDEKDIVSSDLTPKLNSIPTITENNVATFDVLEALQSITPQTDLLVNDENLTVEIPQGWNVTNQNFTIDALAQNYHPLADPNITQSEMNNGNWTFFPSNEPAKDRLGFRGYLDGNLNITASETLSSTPDAWVPPEALAVWYQNVSKPDPDLEIHETDYLSAGTQQYPLWNDLTTEPDWNNKTIIDNSGNDWQQDINNPYGGEKGYATRTLTYNDVQDSLDAYIHAGSSNLTLGNPSLGWKVNFTEPTTSDFNPKKYELIMYWSVVGDYDAHDNLSVIARIDNQYIDGRYDSDGNEYFTNATAYSLENSYNNNDAYLEHGPLVRTYDVTDLIDNRKVNHTLDFGIWLENINETSDEVEVNFYGVFFRAIEEDQYDIGDFGFNCSVNFQSTEQMEDWVIFTIFQNSSHDTWLPIGYVQDLFDNPVDNKYLKFNLTSRLKGLLNSPWVYLFIGIINVGGLRKINPTFSINFDDILYEPIYKEVNFTKAGLQYWNGTQWINQTSNAITAIPSLNQNNLTMAFRTINPRYNESFLDFTQNILLQRSRENNASASYYIPEFEGTSPDKIFWNVTYNNTDTFNQIINEHFVNLYPISYNFSYVDLPAWDNLGQNSTDWEWTGGFDPLGNVPGYAEGLPTNGTANDPSTQNSTVIAATEKIGENNYINGTWILTYTSKNYLTSASLQHETITSPYFYDGNDTIIEINLTESGLTGNYNITLQSSSNTILTDFPKYFLDHTGNLSDAWVVEDIEIGQYNIVSFWNDSNEISGQTLRVGAYCGNFEVWRRSQGEIRKESNILSSGDIGWYYFNLTGEQGTPLENGEAYMDLYHDKPVTPDTLWGTDWPPHQYLLDNIIENSSTNAEGNYTLSFKTRSVPVGIYNVYIQINIPYYDEILLISTIQIVGFSMDLEVISGGFTTQKYLGYIEETNFPRVNDASSCELQINVTNSTNHAALRNGQISGTFNGSDIVFYGTEIYTITQQEADKGLYNITMDATGLNTTNRNDIYNYSLTISVTVDGYNSSYIQFTTEVLPISTQLDRDLLDPIYEENTLDFYITYQNINNFEDPKPLNDASLEYTIKNSENQVMAVGSLEWLLSGVYFTEFDFTAEGVHLSPGFYSVIINGNQLNCENASWVQSDFEIIAKTDSQIDLTIPDFLQIGKSMNIQANLSFTNGTAIDSAEIHLILNFEDSDPIDVFRTTDNEGLILYTQTIGTEYADSYLNITAIYMGTETIQNYSITIFNKYINGKNEVALSLTLGSTIQTGYTSYVFGDISIETYSDYDNIFITLAAWFDGDDQNLFFLQQIYVDADGTFDYTTNAIPDGHQTITFFADYSGTTTNEYASSTLGNQLINGKWETEFNLTNLEDLYRIGQEIELNISAVFLDQSCPLDFYTQSIYVIYEYEGASPIITQSWFGITNFILVNYEIPQDCSDWLNITLDFAGNDTIQSYSVTYTLSIWEKWDVNFSIDEMVGQIRQGYEISYNISGLFLNASSSESLDGLALSITINFGTTVYYYPDERISVNLVELAYSLPYQNNPEYMNITINFSGTSKIKAFSATLNYPILSRWTPVINVESSSNFPRQGETLIFSLSGGFLEENCTESVTGLTVSLIVDIEELETKYNGSFNLEGKLLFNYTVPVGDLDQMQILITTFETSKLFAFTYTNTTSILPQLTTRLSILDGSDREEYTGEFSFRVQLTTEDGSPVPGETIYFNLIQGNEIVASTNAITNSEGIAVVTFKFDQIGEFTIEPYFESSGFYAESSAINNPELQYNIRIVNFGVILLDNILYIGITIASIAIVSMGIYRGIYVPRRNARQKQMMEIHQQFTDIENIQYLIISHIETGVSIFSHTFTQVPIDESLISGFLSAISSFGAEIGSKVSSAENGDDLMTPRDTEGLEELGYKQFKIIVINGSLTRISVLLLKSASFTLKRSVKNFISKFENKYFEELTHWTGKALESEPIVKLLEKDLHVDLLYPHNVVLPKYDKYKKSLAKKSTKNLILKEAKSSFEYSFKVREMIMSMAQYGKREVDTFNAINELRKDEIVFAVNTQTLSLAEEFRPMISKLTNEQKSVLRNIQNGVKTEKELLKATNIPVIIPVITKLEHFELVTNDLQLTPNGEIIATLLNMIPNL